MPLAVHRRVEPNQALDRLKRSLERLGMQTDHNDIFVIRQSNGDIFYFHTEISDVNREKLIGQEMEDTKTKQSPLGPHPNRSAKIKFRFYGQASPGPEIKKRFSRSLKDKLGLFTEQTMVNLLQKNPKFKFDQLDFQFLISQHRSPTQSFIWKLPDLPDLYLFILFLKQNISTHLGIHSIRIQADENRLIPGHKSSADETSQTVHRSRTPAAIGNSDIPHSVITNDSTNSKTFRVKISSDDITFVYFPLPRVRSKSHRKTRSQRPINSSTTMTNSILLDAANTGNTTSVVVPGPGSESEQSTSTTTTTTTQYNSNVTNNINRRRSSAMSASSQHQHPHPAAISNMNTMNAMNSMNHQNRFIASSSQRTGPTSTGLTGGTAEHHSFEDSSLNDDNPIYKLGASFGSGLAILKCGVVTGDDHDKLSHAMTCINRMKTNDLTKMTIKLDYEKDTNLQDTLSMVESIIYAEPKCLDPPKGGHLTTWKSPTAIQRNEKNQKIERMRNALKKGRERSPNTSFTHPVGVVKVDDHQTPTPTVSPKQSVSPAPCPLPPESDRNKMLTTMPSNSSFLDLDVDDHDDHEEDGYAATYTDNTGDDDGDDDDSDDSVDNHLRSLHLGRMDLVDVHLRDLHLRDPESLERERKENQNREREQRSFAIELWSRPDTGINAEALSSKFNEAMKQSMYEYAVEWLALMFQSERKKLIDDGDGMNHERTYHAIYSRVIQPILSVMDRSIEMSGDPQQNAFKSKSCHRFQYNLPSTLWTLDQVTHSVLVEVSNLIPIMPITVLCKCKDSKEGDTNNSNSNYNYKVQSRQQFVASLEMERVQRRIHLDPGDVSYVILGGISIFEEESKEHRRPKLLRRSSASENYKMYGPKQLFSIRSTLHRHCLFMATIDTKGVTAYHYNWNLDKIHRFQVRMDQLMCTLHERAYTLNSIMLHQMGLSSSLHSLPIPRSAGRTANNRIPEPLRQSQSAGSMAHSIPPPPESMESSLMFESLWNSNSTQSLLHQYRDNGGDRVRGICGTSKATLFEIGRTRTETADDHESHDDEYLSHSPNLSPTPTATASFRSHSICSTAVPISNLIHIPPQKESDRKSEEEKKRKMKNENGRPQLMQSPMDIHFEIMEQRVHESLRKRDRLHEISKILLRAKYLNELVTDNRNRYWKRKMDDVLRFCLQIHEVRCPFLIQCRKHSHHLMEQISSPFIMELSKYMESKIASLRRLIDVLVYTFKMDTVTRQIMIVPAVNIQEVVASFYLLPETPYSCSLNHHVVETHSLFAQQSVLRNVLEDLEQTMACDLGQFVSRWCTQFVIQSLDEEQKASKMEDSIHSNLLSHNASRAVSAAVTNDDGNSNRKRKRYGKEEQTNKHKNNRSRPRQRSATTVDDPSSYPLDDLVADLEEEDITSSRMASIDWMRTIRGLNLEETVHSGNGCIFMRFEIAIEAFKLEDGLGKDGNDKKHGIPERQPLYRWFSQYGFHLLEEQEDVAFVVAEDHLFRFQGPGVLNAKMYHSKLMDGAVIILLFSGHNTINAYFIENVAANAIRLLDRHKFENDTDIMKFIEAPNMNEVPQSGLSEETSTHSMHQLVVSASMTPKLMPTPHHQNLRSRSNSPLPPPRVFSLSNIAHAEPQLPDSSLNLKSISVDAVLGTQLSLSLMSRDSDSSERHERSPPQFDEEKMAQPIPQMVATPLRSDPPELVLMDQLVQNSKSMSAADLRVNVERSSITQQFSDQKLDTLNDGHREHGANSATVHRRWSLSGDTFCEDGNTPSDSEMKRTLICKMMQTHFTNVVTQIVSEWHKSPYIRECEDTFEMIVDSIRQNQQRSPRSSLVSRGKSRSAGKPLDISRLERLRQYFWKSSLKEIVRSNLAESKNSENALAAILCDLQSAVGSGQSAVSFSKFVGFCQSNEKIGKLAVSMQVMDSLPSSQHLFVRFGSTSQLHHGAHKFLIHFYLKMNDDGNTLMQRLGMEVIGKNEARRGSVNRETLSDLIEIMAAFVARWKRL